MTHFVLSPCGTSMFTGGSIDTALRRVLGKNANKKEEDVDEADKGVIKKHFEAVEEKILGATPHEVLRMSAELHALVRFYNFKMETAGNDFHLLLTTDTWQGARAGAIVAAWLKKHKMNAEVLTQPDLQTADLQAYRWALADLAVSVEERSSLWRQSGKKVVFNLTGGFKSVQGFLQTLAMLYADETIYVFETQTQLFRLPRLPITFTPDDVVEKNFDLFRKMKAGLKVNIPEGVPELMFLTMGDKTALSEMGAIHYASIRKKLYRQRLFAPVCGQVRFGEGFLKSTRSLPADRLYLVNERLEDLCAYFLSGKKKNLKRLDFKALKNNPLPPYTHELDAWSDRDAKRIFCRFEKDVCILEELRGGLH